MKINKKILLGIALAFTAYMGSMTFSAFAATNIIYNNIPDPTPGNLPSQAYEATSTSEFGGQIEFAGTLRDDPQVTVLMSSWGCKSGNWYDNTCVTTPGSNFSHPITLKICAVNPDNSPGALITTKEQSFDIPYRPSADNTNCSGGDLGKWHSISDNACYNGFNTPITFDLTGITLPDKVIVGVAYNTSHYGYTPIGEAACYSESGGCGYDSLNVSTNPMPTVGTALPSTSDAYINSLWNGAYCPGNVGVGIFKLDTGCWTGYLPSIKVGVEVDFPSIPSIEFPANGASVAQSAMLKVDWSDSTPGTFPLDGYQYEAFGDAGYSSLIYSSGWLTLSEIPTPGTPLGDYFLRVRARDTEGNMSAWSNGDSDVHKITVIADPTPTPTPINSFPVPAQCNQNIAYNLIEGSDGSNNINGTSGSDLILANGGSDKVDGKGGADCIVGGEGSDKLIGGSGNDVILGEGGSDTLLGDNDMDKLYGGDGSDSLKGGAHDDMLWGGDHSDSLNGDGGSDILDGEAGVDSAKGGTGTDTCTAEAETSCEV